MLKIFAIFLLIFSEIECKIQKSGPAAVSSSCGISKRSTNNYGSVDYFQKSDYPWMVILMERQNNSGTQFLCTGTLISKKKVITAAHCIYPKKGERKLARDIVMIFGGHDLDNAYEIGRVMFTPNKIFVHPDWNPFNDKFNADIAILEMENDIQTSESIQPVCLWRSDSNPPETSASVIGYELSTVPNNIYKNLPSKQLVTVYQKEFCNSATDNTFCAGAIGENIPCLRDNGNGIFVNYNGVYYLYGVASYATMSAASCQISRFVIYTSALKYKTWIPRPSEKYSNCAETSTKAPATKSSSSSSPRINVNPFSSCGIMNSATGLVHGGKLSLRNQFPWMAIIAKDVDNNGIFSHRGSGCLISNKHVIVKAGAVSNVNSEKKLFPVLAKRVKVFLGTSKYDDLSEPGSLKVDVEKIVTHPKATDVMNSLYLYDLSIVFLKQEISFTEYIKPVCIWPFGDDRNSMTGKESYAVGYGRDQTGNDSLRKKHVRVTATSCANHFKPEFDKGKDLKLFCAVGGRNEGPCKRDGMLFTRFYSTWFVKGIFTTNYAYSNETCVTSKPTLYNHISLFVKWIETEVN